MRVQMDNMNQILEQTKTKFKKKGLKLYLAHGLIKKSWDFNPG